MSGVMVYPTKAIGAVLVYNDVVVSPPAPVTLFSSFILSHCQTDRPR